VAEAKKGGDKRKVGERRNPEYEWGGLAVVFWGKTCPQGIRGKRGKTRRGRRELN